MASAVLIKPRDAGGAFGVPDVALDRADPARLIGAALGHHGLQRAQLHRITGARAGAVRLDVLHVGGR
jgi:hypothetical protein